MRRANDNGLLKDGDKLIGINLGADYCAEHEWGIKGLRQSFGMKDSGYGLEKRTATLVPQARNWKTMQNVLGVQLLETKKETILIVGVGDEVEAKNVGQYLELGRYDDRLVTSWDEKSFGINAQKKEDRQAVIALYNAILRKDIAIWTGGGGVFQNAGLVIAIASAIPADKAKMLYDADVDKENVRKAGEETGIAKKLEKAGKKWFALSPSWLPENMVTVNGPRKSAYKVMFWLNPQEQNIHEAGWFTVEELEQWISNQGPCIRKTPRGW